MVAGGIPPPGRLVPAAPPVPALDIGGTHVTGALVDPAAGAVTGPTARRALDPDASAPRLLDLIIECGRDVEAPPGAVWAVSIPGPFDYANGIALFEGVGKFDALRGADMRSALIAGLRAREVVFLNDADAFLLGEWRSGAARGHRRCAGITLGSGVGSAFAANGRIIDSGPAVPPEGRADLLTYRGHPLEDTVSRRAIVAAYGSGARPSRARQSAQATGGAAAAEESAPTLDVDVIARRARAGEPQAQQVITRSLGALAEVLAPWLQAFRASRLVVGGSIAKSWDVLAVPLNTGLRSHGAPGVTAVPAQLTGAGLIGAAEHVTRHRRTPG
jgi:glucokinase